MTFSASRVAPLLAVLALVAVAIPAAHAGAPRAPGGERSTVRQVLRKIATHPVPLPGTNLRFGISPVVQKTDTKTTKVVGIVSAVAHNEKASAAAGLVAYSEHGHAAGLAYADGGKNAISLGFSNAGKSALGLAAFAKRGFAVAAFYAESDDSNAVAGMFGFGGKRGYGLVYAEGDEGSAAGVAASAWGMGGTERRFGLFNGMVALFNLIPKRGN